MDTLMVVFARDLRLPAASPATQGTRRLRPQYHGPFGIMKDRTFIPNEPWYHEPRLRRSLPQEDEGISTEPMMYTVAFAVCTLPHTTLAPLMV
jgi:hypothetical protein